MSYITGDVIQAVRNNENTARKMAHKYYFLFPASRKTITALFTFEANSSQYQ